MRVDIVNRRIRLGVGLILATMAFATVALILAGVAESRAYLARTWQLPTARPYPWRPVAVACVSVLAEGLVFVLFIVRLKRSLLFGATSSGAVATLLAAWFFIEDLGVDHPPAWSTFHFMWLVVTAFLMAALAVVGLCAATARRCRGLRNPRQ